MPTRTTNLQLYKPAGNEVPDIDLNNANMDTLDTEVAARAKSVNGVTVDPETGNIPLPVVPYAENLQTSQSQSSAEDFLFRATGGEASLEDGDAWLTLIKGNKIHSGYVAQSVVMTVTPETGSDITAEIDEDDFIAEVSSASGTMTFTYTSSWSADPADYGITVTGTPVSGDTISVDYVKEVRGTITFSDPAKLISTGWNLYDHSKGYAKVKKYSNEYGFMIAGAYSAISFSTTIGGTQTVITPVSGYFTIEEDGYIFVTGGNGTTTQIWMTWSDWGTAALANGGVWEAYTEDEVDLSDVMDTYFPNGLMAVGTYQDEINLNIGKATSNVLRMVYSAANLEVAIATGRDYEYDEDYIYVGRAAGIVYDIDLGGGYSASDHGVEYFTESTVAVYAQTLYGANLKNKLERDVLTISQQTLTAAQKAQVLANIGGASSDQIATINDQINNNLYITTGLTTSDCSIDAGGYHKFGKLVVVNLRLATTSGSFSVNGFPTYNGQFSKNIVACTINNIGDSTSENGLFAYISRSGVLTCVGTSGKTYAIFSIYMCD